MDTFDLLIHELGSYLGIENLKLSNEKTCQIVINYKYKINIEASEAYDSIFFYWNLESKNLSTSSDYYKRLLSFNYMGVMTNGASFSVNNYDEAILNIRLDSNEISKDKFIKKFEDFTSAVATLQEEISIDKEDKKQEYQNINNLTSDIIFV